MRLQTLSDSISDLSRDEWPAVLLFCANVFISLILIVCIFGPVLDRLIGVDGPEPSRLSSPNIAEELGIEKPDLLSYSLSDKGKR